MFPQMEKARAAATGATVVRRAACLAPTDLRAVVNILRFLSDVCGRRRGGRRGFKEEELRWGKATEGNDGVIRISLWSGLGWAGTVDCGLWMIQAEMELFFSGRIRRLLDGVLCCHGHGAVLCIHWIGKVAWVLGGCTVF